MLIGIEQEFVFKDAARTYLDFETGRYPVFQGIVDAFPLHPEDAGVFIQFRGYDACADEALLRALLVLFRGVLLSPRLRGREPRQNAAAIRSAATHGFADPAIRNGAGAILLEARRLFADEADALDLLAEMLVENDSHAARMRAEHARNGDIMAAISDRYRFGAGSSTMAGATAAVGHSPPFAPTA